MSWAGTLWLENSVFKKKVPFELGWGSGIICLNRIFSKMWFCFWKKKCRILFLKMIFLQDEKLFFVRVCFFDLVCTCTLQKTYLEHPGCLQTGSTIFSPKNTHGCMRSYDNPATSSFGRLLKGWLTQCFNAGAKILGSCHSSISHCILTAECFRNAF